MLSLFLRSWPIATAWLAATPWLPWNDPGGAPLPLVTAPLQAARHEVARGDTLSLTFGDDPDTEGPWPEVEHLFVRVSGTQVNLHHPRAADGITFTRVMETAGVAMIGADLSPVTLRIAPAQREELARAVGAAAVDRFLSSFDRDRVLRLRHHRSSTTLVVVRDPAGPPLPSGTAQSKAGQRAEIRLLADPTLLPVGTDLPVRAYVRGGGLANAVLTATPLGRRAARTGQPAGARTPRTLVANPAGMSQLTVDRPGLWQLEFHELRLADPFGGDGDDGAPKPIDGELYSASLTFVVPGAEDGR